MSSVSSPHIELDERGVAGTRHKVKMIVLDRIAYGWSPEEIHFQYPDLSMAQIHAALAYYYDHKDEIDSQIVEEHDEARRLWEQDQDSPIRRKLRGILDEARADYRKHGGVSLDTVKSRLADADAGVPD